MKPNLLLGLCIILLLVNIAVALPVLYVSTQTAHVNETVYIQSDIDTSMNIALVSGERTLRFPDGKNRVEFQPLRAGEYRTVIQERGKLLVKGPLVRVEPSSSEIHKMPSQGNVESTPVSLGTSSTTYSPGETVLVTLTRNLNAHEYMLVHGPDMSYELLGNSRNSTRFVPHAEGTYNIDIMRGKERVTSQKFLVKKPQSMVEYPFFSSKTQGFMKHIHIKNISGKMRAILEKPARGISRIILDDFKQHGTFGVEDLEPNAVPINRGLVAKAYAFDPTQAAFANGSLTAVAQGDELWKCKEWNFTEQRCYGSWQKIRDLVPGKNYTIPISQADPGFGEIIITKAFHLDDNLSFVRDVYNESRYYDDVWTETIPEGHRVRVTFDKPIRSGNTIYTYAKAVSPTGQATLTVYRTNTTEVVARTTLGNASWYAMVVDNQPFRYDTFDFVLTNGSAQFDYIEDPAPVLYGEYSQNFYASSSGGTDAANIIGAPDGTYASFRKNQDVYSLAYGTFTQTGTITEVLSETKYYGSAPRNDPVGYYNLYDATSWTLDQTLTEGGSSGAPLTHTVNYTSSRSWSFSNLNELHYRVLNSGVRQVYFYVDAIYLKVKWRNYIPNISVTSAAINDSLVANGESVRLYGVEVTDPESDSIGAVRFQVGSTNHSASEYVAGFYDVDISCSASAQNEWTLVHARDTVNTNMYNWESLSLSWICDADAPNTPSLSITGFDPGDYLTGSSVTINCAQQGDVGLSGINESSYNYEYNTSTTGWTSICTHDDSTCVWSLPADDTDVNVRCSVADNVSQRSSWDTVYYAGIDSTPPVTDLDMPPNYTNISCESYTVNASATDAGGVDTVTFLYRSSPASSFTVMCTDATSPYSCSWNTCGLAEGNLYEVRAYANDSVNNIGANDTHYNITIDLSGPETTLTNPVNDSNFSSQSISVSATATDAYTDVASVTFLYRTGPETAFSTICTDNSFPFSCSWNVSGLADGATYEIRAYGTDILSNIGANATAVNVTIDRQPPLTTLLDPANYTNISTSSYAMLASVTDTHSAIDTVTFLYSVAETGPYTLACSASTSMTCAWDTSVVNDGVYFVRAYANDSVGNNGTNATHEGITLDRTEPTISLESPGANNWSTASTTFSYNVSDLSAVANCSLYVDGNKEDEAVRPLRNTSQTLSATLSHGTHTWDVRCTDSLNFTNTSDSRSVRIDAVNPFIDNGSVNDTLTDINEYICIMVNVTDADSSLYDVRIQVEKPITGLSAEISLSNATTACGGGGYTWSTDFLNNENGSYILNVTYAEDYAGNVFEKEPTPFVNWSGIASIFTNVTLEEPSSDVRINETYRNTDYVQRCLAGCPDGPVCENVSIFIEQRNVTKQYFSTITTGSTGLNASVDGYTCGDLNEGDYCEFAFNVSGNPDMGNNVFSVRCKVNSTNTPQAFSSAVNVSMNDAPTALITYPTNESYLSSIETLNASSTRDTDGSIVTYTFEIDNVTTFTSPSLIAQTSSNTTSFDTTAQTQCVQETTDCYLRVTALDNDGLNDSVIVTIGIDNLAPRWSDNTTHPESPQTYNASTSYQFNMSWTEGVSQTVWIEHNFTGAHQNVTVSTSVGNVYYYNYPALAAGSYIYRWYANDSQGNLNTSPTFHYDVMQDTPILNLSLDGQTTNISVESGTTVVLRGELINPDYGSLTLYRNGTIADQGTTPVEVNSYFLTPHYYNITLRYDSTQNFTEGFVTYYVNTTDTTAPNWSTNNTFPNSGEQYTPSRAYTFNMSWSDMVGVASVRIEHNFSGTLQQYPVTPTDDEVYTYTYADLAAAGYVYRWYANDSDGNLNTSPQFVYVITRNDSALRVLINGSENNFTINEQTYANLTVVKDTGEGNVTLFSNASLLLNTETSASLLKKYRTPGVYNITGRYEQTQNYTEAFTTYYLNVTDTTAPNVTVIAPDNDSIDYDGSVTFRYSVNDTNTISSCNLVINNSIEDTQYEVPKIDTQNFVVNNMLSGNYSWYINCTDHAGLTGQSEVRTIEIDIQIFTIRNLTPVVAYLDDGSDQTANVNVSDEVNKATISDIKSSNTRYLNATWETNVPAGASILWFNVSVEHNDQEQVFIKEIQILNGTTWDTVCALSSSTVEIDETCSLDDHIINYTWAQSFTLRIQFDSNSRQPRSSYVDFFRVSFSYETDTTEPAVTLVLPVDGAYATPGNITFVYTPDDLNLDNCTLYGDFNGTYLPNETDMNPVNGVSNNFTINVAYGFYNWNVYCIDVASNIGHSFYNFTVNVTYPDLQVNHDEIWFNVSEENTREGLNITINATIHNVGNLNVTEPFEVAFYEGDPDNGGTQIGAALTVSSLGAQEWIVLNQTWIVPGPGNFDIYVHADIPIATGGVIQEVQEDDNEAFTTYNVPAYHTYYGDFTLDVVLGTELNITIKEWLNKSTFDGNIFAADADAVVSFSSLHAISRNLTQVFIANDFSDVDATLNMTNFTDSINATYTANNLPKSTRNFTIYQNVVRDVPIVNSTNTSSFMTGILWDANDANPGEFNGSQDIVFVSALNLSKAGEFGTYDYEITIPVRLEQQYDTTLDEVTLYYEII